MKLSCENCHSEFYYEPSPAGDTVPFAKCPQCDFPNPVPVDHGSLFGDAEVAVAQCFNCGRKMAHDPDQAIPICPACQQGAEKVEQSKDWMVRKSAGQIYGPFDLETLQAWIAAHKIDPEDEVSKVGGQWKPFHAHPQFSRLFDRTRMRAAGMASPVAPPIEEPDQPEPAEPRETKKKKAKKRKLSAREIASIATKIILTAGIAVAAGMATVEQWLIVPEPWIRQASALYHETVGKQFEKSARIANPVTQEMAALLRELRARHPDVDETSATLFTRGRTLFLLDTPRSLLKARVVLEQAVVANPLDDLALSALALLYAEDGDIKLQQDAQTLIEQAGRLNPSNAEVKRAAAAFAIATQQFEKARNEARSALRVNPGDAEAEFYIGMSYFQAGESSPDDAIAHLKKAVELDPLLHKAYHQLGRVYFDQHEYRRAYQAFQRKISIEPGNAQALADLGRLHERIGEYGKAIDYYERAYRRAGNTNPVIMLDYAVLLYQVKGALRRARSLLTAILP